jgi:hypothetical protein
MSQIPVVFIIFEKRKIQKMKAAINIDITYNQILSLVKNLTPQEKLKLSRELEKEGIRTKLSSLLKAFKTDDLSLETIEKEAELIRKKLYDHRKKH